MTSWLLRFGVFVAALFLGLAAAYLAVARLYFDQERPNPDVWIVDVDPFSDATVDEAADERSIYLAVYAEEGFIVNRPLIEENTFFTPGVGLGSDPGSIDGASPDAIADFQSKNNQQLSLRTMFPNVPVLGFVTQAQQDAIFGREHYVPDGWQMFKRRFPKANGILSFSRIGFDHDHTQAIVYFAHS